MKRHNVKLGMPHLTFGVALAMLAGSTPAQQVPIPKTPAEVPGPASGNTMTKEYVQTVGRMRRSSYETHRLPFLAA